MNHLTDEQFEDILHGNTNVPEHVERCARCRARLDEKRAVARRVHQAFSSIQAPPGLADRIRAGIAASAKADATPERARIIPLYLHRHLWSGLGAVAAVLVLAVSIGLFVGTGSQANAAQVALTEIHHLNLDALGQLVNEQDPNALCAYMEGQVGHCPAMPHAGSGMNTCGCCVRQFQGQQVASYVVQAKDAPVSVIVVPESPEDLGLTPRAKTAAMRDIWQGKHACCNIACVRRGEYSYCAVGQVTQKELATVLNALPE